MNHENIESFIREANSLESDTAIKRWQLKVFAYLETAINSFVAEKFKAREKAVNIWDDLASQVGYLVATSSQWKLGFGVRLRVS